METKLTNIVIRLKEVKAERPDLTLQKIADHTGVPLGTVTRVFAEGSESVSFRYESVMPIANMLLDLDDVGEGNGDEKAYKAIIQFYETSISQMKEQFEKKLEEERAEYKRRIEFLMHQIEKKDERIDKLFEMVNNSEKR